MVAYVLRRLALMIPTLLGIMLISFVIVQFAPGGPVERVLAQLQGNDVSATSRIAGSGADIGGQALTLQPGGSEGSGGSIGVHRGLIPNSSSSSKRNSALTSLPTNGFF